MPIKVNLKTRIRFNGQEYDSVEAMPQEARAVYERALAHPPGTAGKRVSVKISVNGREYASPDEMPPELRAQYDRIMGQMDANHNGVPDVLEGGQLPMGSVMVPQAQSSQSAVLGDDAANAWPESPDQQQSPQVPSPFQSPASFPVVSGEPSGSRRLVLTVVALLVLLAGVVVIGLVLWSQIGPR